MAYFYPFKDVDEVTKLIVWQAAKEVPSKDPDEWRLDLCGRLIKFSDHGKRDSQFGWEIDHIKPKALKGSDNIENLQALHWENNSAKGDTYPWKCPKRHAIDLLRR